MSLKLIYLVIGGGFPWGTLIVNSIGSFIIGFLWVVFENISLPPTFKVFIFVGVLGGFTTFSAYTLESLHLFREGNVGPALFNLFANNVLGLLFVLVGFLSANYMAGLFQK